MEPAGKGINVAVATAVNGGKAVAVYPASRDDDSFGIALRDLGVETAVIPIGAAIRHNVTIVTDDGVATKINEPGAHLSPKEVDELINTTVRCDPGNGWIVASGSLPPGAGDDFFVRLSRAIPESGSRLAIDTSGSALAAAADGCCAVMKPNLSELRSLVDADLEDLGSVVDAANSVRPPGSALLVSLGADGAVLIESDSVHYGHTETPEVANTVGAGDALLAGFLAAGGRGADSLREALAWAQAALRSVTTIGARVVASDRAAVKVQTKVPRGLRFTTTEEIK